MSKITEEMIEAGLDDLRDRRLLKYLFASEPQTSGAYGYVDQPLDVEVQREVVAAIYTAMHKARPVEEGKVERVANAILREARERGADSPMDRGDAEQLARAAIQAIGDNDG